MTGTPETVSFGEELTVRLRNATDEPLRTGTSEQHTIQSGREDGWQNVLVEPDGFDGAAVEHPPGEGFTWEFVIDADGYGGPWEVCGPLTPGTYRFVYWGLGDAPPTATPGDPDYPHFAVAFRFTVRE